MARKKPSKVAAKPAGKKAAKKVLARSRKPPSGARRGVGTSGAVSPSRMPKEWRGGRIVFGKPPAKPLKGRSAERLPATDVRDAEDRPIPRKVCDWFVWKLDSSHKFSIRTDDHYGSQKLVHLSPEAAQLLREKSLTWVKLANAARASARKREQASLDSLATAAAPEDFKDGKLVLAKPQRPVAEAHCWKPDFEGEVYQAVLHYYGYLPAEHFGSSTDPNGYPAKVMSPEAAQLYRAHRAFWEAKYAEFKVDRRTCSAVRKRAAEVAVDKNAAIAGLSRAELEAKLDKLGALVEQGNLRLVADMITAFDDAWLYEALLAGSVIEPNGALKPGSILKRFGKRSGLVLLLALAGMPDGLSLDPSLRRDALISTEVKSDAMDIVAEILPRLPNLKPQLTSLFDVKELSPPLAALIGKHASEVTLEITRLSTEEAAGLANVRGTLELNCLETLDAAVAVELSRHEGFLSLGIKELPDEIAASLASHQGGLSFPNLEAISRTAAAALEKHVGWLELGPDRVDAAVAQHLARHAGPVGLGGVRRLDPQTAAILAGQRHGLRLGAITEFPDGDCGVRLCECLARTPMTELYLPDLESVGADCASALAAFSGELALSAKTWSEDALIAIAKHKGKLTINPGSISGKAAAALSARGPSSFLVLEVTSLRDDAAACLRSYQGQLILGARWHDERFEMSRAAATHLTQRQALGLRKSKVGRSIQKIFKALGTWHMGRFDPDAYWQAESLCLWMRDQ